MNRCKTLIRELPQQRWKEGTGDSLKDEADRDVRHDAVDCLLYTVRQLPLATEVKITPVSTSDSKMSLMSRLYWEDVKKQKELESQGESRRPYNPGHVLGGAIL
jgi:hypothetical protein